MDYEQKYKEALELARDYYKANLKLDKTDENLILEDIFSELAESEDELTWLTKYIEEEAYSLSMDIRDNEDRVKLKNLKRSLAWLEKQGEHKDNLSAQEAMDIAIAKCFDEDEQKSVDKVDPKFQNGQWIVWQNKCYKVNYNECGYELIDQNGLSTSLEYGTVDKSAHLWTIQDDAKDGDVLYCKSFGITFIIILKCINQNRSLDSYCRYNTIAGFAVDVSRVMTINDNPKPATKSQRDTLFAKMREAGYEWDAEKKKLKKIKFRVVDEDKAEMDYCFTKMMNGEKVSPSEEDEEYNGEDYGVDSLYHAQRILEKTLGKVDGYQTDDGILSHKCAISAVKKLYEQKPSWSEGDEEELEITIDTLKESGQYDSAEWVQSLKQRIGG